MQMKPDTSRLRRARNPMPASIRQALKARGVLDAYRGRPAYQQNDYLGWIARAKLVATKEKRLAQMLEELARGDVYMNMKWSGGRVARPKARTAPAPSGSSRRTGGPAATRSPRRRDSGR